MNKDYWNKIEEALFQAYYSAINSLGKEFCVKAICSREEDEVVNGESKYA